MIKRGNKIESGMNYKQLLSGLTKRELDIIRKNWDFKGISSLI